MLIEGKKSLYGTSTKQCNIRAGRGWPRLRAQDTPQKYDPYIHKDGPHPELCVPEAAAEVPTEGEVSGREMGWREVRFQREEGRLQKSASARSTCTIHIHYLLSISFNMPSVHSLYELPSFSLYYLFITNVEELGYIFLCLELPHTDLFNWSVTTTSHLWSDLAILSSKIFIHQAFASD